MARFRTAAKGLLVFPALLAGIVLWKGVSLLALHAQIGSRLQAVAAYYGTQIEKNGTTLQAATDSLPSAQREPVNAFAASLAPLESDARPEDVIAAQKEFIRLLNAAETAPQLAARPEMAELADALRSGGKVQPLLDTYNIPVQAWNLSIEDPLGRLYARLLGLEPRLLLRADGRAEYETTISF